jgi:hypothetical protein
MDELFAEENNALEDDVNDPKFSDQLTQLE